jgi:hypothetical protein
MATHLDDVVLRLRNLHRTGLFLIGHDHELDDLTALVREAGALVERFLKAHVLPSPVRGELDAAIGGLKALGVPARERDVLERFRIIYNSAKHDPTFHATPQDVTTRLLELERFFATWVGRRLGRSEEHAQARFMRELWVAAWDYFTQGDTQVMTFLPGSDGVPDQLRRIDTIDILGTAWPDVLSPLGDSVRPARGLIPAAILRSWEHGDFAGARVFYGEYRDLVRALARQELPVAAIDSRPADLASIRTAVLMAAVDAARDTPDSFDLATEISARAAAEYAAAEIATRSLIQKLTPFLRQLPADLRRRLIGPRFVSAEHMQRWRVDQRCDDLYLAISDDTLYSWG